MTEAVTDALAFGVRTRTPIHEPLALAWRYRRVIGHLTRRDIAVRYRGSLLGTLWAVLNPLLLLVAYTFVFTTIFRMKWNVGLDNKAQFAIVVFAGMVVHGFFADCAGRAPGLVIANANYVKRVVFPLDVLPWVCVLSALFHTAIGLVVLLGFVLVESGSLPPTVALVPLVMLPLVVLSVGAVWLLAAIGTYLRDLGYVVGLLVMLLLFLSPVFYPLDAVPPEYRDLIAANPLTLVIEQLRAVAIFGQAPDWPALAAYTAGAYAFAWFGLYVFRRARRGFADVL